MAAETGFQIDGTIYQVPPIDTLNLDEAQVLYDYSGLTIESFVRQPNETPEEAEAREAKFDNPGFLRALMHISYQRAHPDLTPAKVKQLIGSANYLTAIETLGGPEGDEAVPPASTTEPDESSKSGSVTSSESSGPASTTDSEQRASGLVRIGTGR